MILQPCTVLFLWFHLVHPPFSSERLAWKCSYKDFVNSLMYGIVNNYLKTLIILLLSDRWLCEQILIETWGVWSNKKLILHNLTTKILQLQIHENNVRMQIQYLLWCNCLTRCCNDNPSLRCPLSNLSNISTRPFLVIPNNSIRDDHDMYVQYTKMIINS